MSSNTAYLAIRLEGPLQSYGFDSQYNRRNTGLMPTKSAIAGMCCAALGYPRGCEEEINFLSDFCAVKMLSISLPRNSGGKPLPVRRLQDYHTVQNTRTAEGKVKDCHITHRQYLTDASFGVILSGKQSLLSKLADCLSDPVWGIWLGRKSCIPSAPVMVGLRENREEALSLLIGDVGLKAYVVQDEAEEFADGRDSLPDTAISFESTNRLFSQRRVRMGSL